MRAFLNRLVLSIHLSEINSKENIKIKIIEMKTMLTHIKRLDVDFAGFRTIDDALPDDWSHLWWR
jgi:hypothetical protein